MEDKDRETKIVESILSGKTDDFDIIINDYRDRLYSFLYRLCLNEAVAEEILQQAFIKAFKYLDKWDSSKGLKNWLYMIARNAFYDYVTKENKFKTVCMEDMQFFLASCESGPEDKAILKSEYEDVLKNIYELKPKYSEILILRYVEEKSYEEIGEILNIPLGTVKIRLHRAKEKLINLVASESG